MHLIKRDVDLTLEPIDIKNLGLFGKLKLVMGLGAGLFLFGGCGRGRNRETQAGRHAGVELRRFASESPELYEAIIGERDHYMATRLRQIEAVPGGRQAL